MFNRRPAADQLIFLREDPLLRWQACNVIVDTDAAGSRKPSKAKSLDRIDGIVTAIFACGLAERDEGPKTYQGTGIAWI